MTPSDAYVVVKKGLKQIPNEGLERCIHYIDSGKPLYLNGMVISEPKNGRERAL